MQTFCCPDMVIGATARGWVQATGLCSRNLSSFWLGPTWREVVASEL